MNDPSPWRARGEALRRQSLALAIPSLFVGSPLGVGALGYFLGRWIGFPKTGFGVGFVLGMVIAVRESVRILRYLSREEDKASGKKPEE